MPQSSEDTRRLVVSWPLHKVEQFDIKDYDKKLRAQLRDDKFFESMLIKTLGVMMKYMHADVESCLTSILENFIDVNDELIRSLLLATPCKKYVSFKTYMDARHTMTSLLDNYFKRKNNSKLTLETYAGEADALIAAYDSVKKKSVSLVFQANKSSMKDYQLSLYNIIAKFITLMSLYCDPHLIIQDTEVHLKKYKTSCQIESACRICNERTTVMHGENLMCGNCGYMFTVLEEESSFKDISRVSVSTKYVYDANSTFTDLIARYQGNKHKQLTLEFLRELVDAFYQNGLIDTAEIDVASEEQLHQAFNQKITKQLMYKILKETKNHGYYNDINYIYSYLTGEPLDDISHLEKTLIAEYKELYEAFIKKLRPGTKKKNMMKGNYVLYRLLVKHKHPCSQYDFNISRTPGKFVEYENEFDSLSRILGWKL